MAAADQLVGSSRVSRGRLARESFGRLRVADQLGLLLFAIVLLVCVVGPVLAPHSPSAAVSAPFERPGSGLLLGSDDVGRDVLSRILYGAQQSIIGAFVVVGAGATFGTAVGLIAGARGGWVDALLMRFTDAFLALPAPMLAIAVAVALGSSYTNAVLAVTVVWWPLYARLVRGEVKALTALPHVEAAKLSGISARRLWVRHLLPGAAAPVVIAASLDLGQVVLALAALSFLGLGSADPAVELGAMTAKGLPYLLSASWVVLFPALAVFVISFGSNLAGDALRNIMAD